jgi:serine/threonine-protein kinase
MRPVVSVHVAGNSSVVRHLAPGARLAFGNCRCGDCPYDLAVACPPAAGRVTADRDHWRLTNQGRYDLVVTDLERPHDLVTVAVGRRDVPVPFELARVTATGRPVLTVFGPEPGPPVAALPGCPALPTGRPATVLDPGTTYFAVLVTLCEPRLRPLVSRSAGLSPLPTSAEVARQLHQRGVSVTVRAVDSHIEYLIDKLRLRDRRVAGGAHRSWRKETLVTAAIRGGLVAEEHLPGPRQPAGWVAAAGEAGGTVRG